MEPEKELTQDQVIEEDRKVREELTAEVFSGEEPEETTVAGYDESPIVESDTDSTPDPWEGVNPAVKESMDKITTQLESLTAMETRLKQTERRIGSIQNETAMAKKAAEEAALEASEAPTPEQIADAEKTDEEWEELKTDFPEWATAIESKLSAQRTEFLKSLPQTEKLEKKVNEDVSGLEAKIRELTIAVETNLVSSRYPDYKNIIDSKEYGTWLAGQPTEIQELTTSNSAKDALKVLDAYNDHAPVKSAADIAKERQKRLKRSESIPNTTTNKQTKSEADLSDEEYRRAASQKIWDET